MSRVSRRGVLGGTAVAAVSKPGKGAAQVPDAELISIAEESLKAAIRMHRWDRFGTADRIEDDTFERVDDIAYDGGVRLLTMRPTTMVGLIAKARLVRVQFERGVVQGLNGDMEEEADWQDDLVWSLLNDLLAMHGALDDLPVFVKGVSGYPPKPEPASVEVEAPNDPEQERMRRIVDDASTRLKAEVEAQSPAARAATLRLLSRST